MQSKSAAPGRPCIRRAKPNQARESKGELDVLLWPAASLIHGSANCLSALFERRFHCHLDHFTKSNLQKAKGLRQAKRNSESTRPEDSGWLSAWFQDLSTCHSRDKWFFLLKPQTQEARTSEETDFLCTVRSVCNIEVIPEDMRICSTNIGPIRPGLKETCGCSEHLSTLSDFSALGQTGCCITRILAPGTSSKLSGLTFAPFQSTDTKRNASGWVCRAYCVCQIHWSRDFRLNLSLVCLAWWESLSHWALHAKKQQLEPWHISVAVLNPTCIYIAEDYAAID